MSYTLRAVIGPEEQLRGTLKEGPVIALSQGFALVPLSDQNSGSPVGKFYGLTEPLQRRLIVASASGPLAYVEAEFFGGAGTQSGIVWRNKVTLLGPLHTQTQDGEEEGFVTTTDLAINEVLRALGVSAADGQDEFDAIGLGRHRDTAGWGETG